MIDHSGGTVRPSAVSPKVVICTADVGCGHGRAATAMALAIRSGWPTIRAQSLDALHATPRWFNGLYRDCYLTLAKLAPRVSGWLYRRTDIAGTPPEKGVGLRIEMAAMRRFCDADDVRDADLIICTHFLCARTLSKRRSQGRLKARIAVVVTDQHPHAIWRVPNADLFLVASESAAAEMRRQGISPDRLLVTGIPIDARFDEPLSKSAARARHGLDEDANIVLITGGGLGLGGIDRALEGALSRGPDVTAVVVCGRNEKLHRRLVRETASLGDRCRILGLTNRMHELMAAADVMVGKPGGLTTSEATAIGLPMVLLRPLPGQEEYNADALVAAGAATLCPDPYEAGVTAARLLTQDSVLNAMRQHSLEFGRRRSARLAAEAALALCDRPIAATAPRSVSSRSATRPAQPHMPLVAAQNHLNGR